ncbi:hypothetical protein [Larkinella rosea]|uniref:Viral A-type inclusion protein n=1 Tax=Larkinella rosea TaxID=2025312 RepID=A0A3P1BU19_9BACT|nr:hypothetical protein [Larkinella rosea]RRB04547.1 hypothetical protein EHT25_13715 [Larkinella rosea]
MKNDKSTVLAIGFLFLFNWACESNKQAETHHHHQPDSSIQTALPGPVAELEKDVLAIHDSLMDRMSEMMQLQEDVSLKLQKAGGQTQERGLQILQQLKETDERMTDWMHHYKGDTLPQLDEKNGVAYLKGQQAKVNKLSQRMRKSMADAQTYLKE